MFRDLVETFPDAILISRNFRTIFVNPAAVHLFGVASGDQILGTSVVDLFAAEHRDAVTNAIERSLRGERKVRADARIVAAGVTRDVEVDVTVVGEPPDSVALIVREVTERRRAELALRTNEERLRLAFAGAQEGVWDWDLETGAVVYSDQWKRMLGYRDDEIEPHVRAWERLLHPDDRAAAESLIDAVTRDKRPYEGEFRLLHKNGHYITVLTRGLPVRRDPDGSVIRIVGTHLDITERKRTESALRESEERLTLAFVGAQEGIWDWNLETNAVVYSSRWKQMLGYSDEEIEPHVSAWERLVHPDDREAADRASESVARGQPTYEAEFRLRHKDGHYVHVLSRGFPVRAEPGGPVVRIVGTHFDLTDRQKREAERVRTELLTHLVFAQEDERRRIARDMHDQLGEHLTALALRIGRLKQLCVDSTHLAPEVDDLEAIALSLDQDVDRLAWELRPTALDDLGLRAALTNYVQNWSNRTSIPAQLHTSGLLDERLAPDVETTLYRIAQEALNNAAKYSRAGHVEVILERRHDSVLLVVEDDGIGFEADGTVQGHGFGLVGMRERAALIGANVEIESAPGQGTTVLVRIDVPSGATSSASHG
ncbi:MAG TPA: PAS domain-containing protein [Vicinamibacterales bacterium]|nr:PAS domain-containing protein [Vicinamibacterales bacterium]